jgi:hypothetical protein
LLDSLEALKFLSRAQFPVVVNENSAAAALYARFLAGLEVLGTSQRSFPERLLFNPINPLSYWRRANAIQSLTKRIGSRLRTEIFGSRGAKKASISNAVVAQKKAIQAQVQDSVDHYSGEFGRTYAVRRTFLDPLTQKEIEPDTENDFTRTRTSVEQEAIVAREHGLASTRSDWLKNCVNAIGKLNDGK